MAMRTITHLYDSYDDAVSVVNALEASGIAHDRISLVANSQSSGASSTTGAAGTRLGTGDPDSVAPTTDEGAGTATGASLGTVLGGGAGLLAGIGALAIPGVGPVVAAGWLVATLTGAGVGAGAGGLLGMLTGAGVHEDDANVYSEGVRRGGTLVSVQADDAEAAQVESVMNNQSRMDPTALRTSYQSEGWERHDTAAPAMTEAEIAASRERFRSL
jgi:hypothetical protein